MKFSRIKLLQAIYDFEQSNNGYFQIEISNNNNDFDTLTLSTDVRYLEKEGFIWHPMKALNCYCLSLTEKGEMFVENGFKSPAELSQNSTFDLSGATLNNAIIGNNLSNNTLNFGLDTSLKKLETLINSKPSADKQQLEELLTALKSLEKSQEPVPRGFFVKFSDLIKKHTDLITAIGTALISVFFAK